MSWRIKATISLLAIAGLLAVLSIYVIATQARDLTNLRKELQEAEAQKAASQAASVYVEDAVPALTDFRKHIETLCSGRDKDPAPENFCRTHSQSLGLFDINLNTLTSRVLASGSGDYQPVRANYETQIEYLERLPQDAWRNGWLARAYEGVAYSEYKMRHLDAADAAARRGRDYDLRSGAPSAFLGTTALKIQCARGIDRQTVASAYDALLKTLRARIASERAPEAARNAALELKRVHDDAELFRACSDANLNRGAARLAPA